LSIGDIANAVSRLASAPERRLAIKTAAVTITDGLGAARVRAACSPAPLAKDGRPVRLRLATMADASLMLAWQSTPGIRAYSRNPDAPRPAEHAQWMRKKLADPQCIFHVILHDENPVGILRLDRQADGGYEISILVAAEAHNQNIGGAALELAKRLLPDAVIHAAIHSSNLASIRMFERAGYRRAGEDWMLAPHFSITEPRLPMTKSNHDLAIAGRQIGPDQPPYFIAEMSANHGGSLDQALAVIEAAAKAGADAIKLQTYTADTITIDCDRPDFLIRGGLWDGRTLYDLYQEAHTPWAWHRELFAKGRELGITVFSSPFDETAVDFLEELRAPAYKVASFELVHLPLLRKIAGTGKPVILSTGMASHAEIEESIGTLRDAGCRELLVLHCTSGYPTPSDEANIRMIPHLAHTFDVPVGLSDHTLDSAVAVAAVALGAVAIEKHFTLRRADGGPDAAFSLEPSEFASLVTTAQTAWAALGRVDDVRAPSEQGNLIFRRSIYAVKDIKKGDRITSESIRVIRPGFGLAPRHYDEVIGRCACADIARGTPISWALIEQA
jgi:pseudaminic acid synthase